MIQTSQKPKTLRIASYNVHFGKHPEKIARVFTENKNLKSADVIFFQEIEFHEIEKISRAETIAKHLGFYFTYSPSRKLLGKGTHGLATLSRFPFTGTQTIKLPKYNLWIHSRQRIALVTPINVEKQTVTLCNIHLDARLNIKQRVQQLDFALKKLQNYKNVIIGGDFNTIPMFLVAKIIPIAYRNQRKKVHQHLLDQGFAHFSNFTGYTMKTLALKMRLDHIYSNKFPIINSGVETKIMASDHKPIWADIII